MLANLGSGIVSNGAILMTRRPWTDWTSSGMAFLIADRALIGLNIVLFAVFSLLFDRSALAFSNINSFAV